MFSTWISLPHRFTEEKLKKKKRLFFHVRFVVFIQGNQKMLEDVVSSQCQFEEYRHKYYELLLDKCMYVFCTRKRKCAKPIQYIVVSIESKN